MSNHVDVPASGATPAPEWTRSTSGASIRRVMVTSVVTVLVAAAVTATSVYLIANEAPTTGVFRDPDYAAAQAAEQQLVVGIDPATDLADILRFGAAAASANEAAEQQLVVGIDPATDLADILRFGAGVGAVSAGEAAYLAQMVYAIDPATSVPESLGLGTVRAQDDSPAIEELVRGIDPSIDVRAALGLGTVPAPEDSSPIEELVRGIDPATDVRDILDRFGFFPPPADDADTTGFTNPPNVR
jgi:hypothetical protein